MTDENSPANSPANSPEHLRAAIDDVERELIGLQAMAGGLQWAVLAAVLALIDSGAISRERILAIIESLRMQALADAAFRQGEPSAHEWALASLADLLDETAWKATTVLDTLRDQEAAAAFRLRKLRDGS